MSQRLRRELRRELSNLRALKKIVLEGLKAGRTNPQDWLGMAWRQGAFAEGSPEAAVAGVLFEIENHKEPENWEEVAEWVKRSYEVSAVHKEARRGFRPGERVEEVEAGVGGR